jgi:plasmid stabilization system protein ParE
VARVELSAAAVEDLDALIRSHSLPSDTKVRLRRSSAPLTRFPLIGAALHGRWSGFRFILGPWRWMILVYVYLEAEDHVVIVTIQDGCSSRFAS